MNPLVRVRVRVACPTANSLLRENYQILIRQIIIKLIANIK
jgi:hypothetical protein